MPPPLPWPSPNGGHSARQQNEAPSSPRPWELDRRAYHWEPSLLQGCPQPQPAFPATLLFLLQPHHAGWGDSTHYPWSIFSLHQNNLTADGRRHLQCSSSPQRGKVHRLGSHSPRMPWVARFQKTGLSNGWVDRPLARGSEGTPSPSFNRGYWGSGDRDR